MTKETTPPVSESVSKARQPPSLPTSPLAKRTKTETADMTAPAIYTPEVAVVEELEESVRGAGGFGSTGV
ncbi:hypothetical protein N7508_004031 [Penicillium antarcticum]|uniref:uncharacterized protein n=1 Tax=Penicillium antarcticum TaxID=416450 RepID=UPI0023893091|nr:uncharacterized protein N7508_004031 [Penicillium antarcticum]KAJ5308652.1 hypothetical protein N7508_004031 [Penicillium antarcticum]